MLGYVFMPNHIHMILHFEDSTNRSAAIRDMKKFTSTQIRKEVENASEKLLKKIEIRKEGRVFKVWMERFDEVYLENRELLELKLDYIHNNPLQERWNLVKRPEDYPFSSASYYELGSKGRVALKDYRDLI